MSKFHHTLSRRDFMKAMGLAGAGLGAAAAASPVFHDMDEVLSQPNSDWKSPWYVKDRDFDNPTVEIDWSIMERYDKKRFSIDPYDEISDATSAKIESWYGTLERDALNKRWAQQGQPGMTHREHAVNNAVKNVENGSKDRDPLDLQELGVSKWQGTPEENLKMMRVVSRFFGSISQGVMEINSNNKKVIWDNDGRTPNLFEDVDEAIYESRVRNVIPNKAKNVFTWVQRHPQAALKTGPSFINNPYGYFFATNTGVRITTFIRNLGYITGGEGSRRLAGSAAVPTLAGVGEMSRAGSEMIIPQHGNVLRFLDLIFTDLPLTPTPPIDAGINRFCESCKKCAEQCPTESISMEDEPSWEITGPWNNPGLKHWYFNYPSCNPFKSRYAPGYCGICLANCTFTKFQDAAIHEVVAATLSTTPIFNSFFRQMDDVMGYGKHQAGPNAHANDDYVEEWWNTIGPELGFLTHEGAYP
jgi:reductive dehalogenase